MIDSARYAIANAGIIETPALVYFKDIIAENTQRAIQRAGGPGRMWPHVKSHKMHEIIKMQQRMGIERFKCATIAEAQMVVECGAAHVLLAYPLVGPNVERFIRLQKSYPKTTFYAIGDDAGQLAKLSEASEAAGIRTRALLDVNVGMNRTGISLAETPALYRVCAAMPGLVMAGLHCYDGHIHSPELAARIEQAQAGLDASHAIRRALEAEGIGCGLLVMGGTPTFPVHAAYEDVYLSPGTVFLGDAMCLHDVRELEIEPGAGVWTRVVSHPAKGLFTLDLGVKGISTDQAGPRGIVTGLETAKPLFQSEEHWVFEMPEGETRPEIGEAFFVIPTHICPTTALYPFAYVVEQGEIVSRWEVTARNRNIGI